MKKLVLFFMMAAAVNAFALGKTKVKRVESSKVTDLDGYWNDTDVRIVCESLIEECITSPRVAKFEEQHGRPGLVIVGEIMTALKKSIRRSLPRNFRQQSSIQVSLSLSHQRMKGNSSGKKREIRTSMQALRRQKRWTMRTPLISCLQVRLNVSFRKKESVQSELISSMPHLRTSRTTESYGRVRTTR